MADFFETQDEEAEYNYVFDKLKGEYPSLKKEDVEYILDIMIDYYEKEGFFDDDNEKNDDLVDIYEDEIFEYVASIVEKDGKKDKFSDQLIDDILACDYAYCEETGIFQDEDDEN